jgi:hypothetical protein
MMRSAFRSVAMMALCAGGLLSAAGVAQAHEEVFAASLSGPAEAPPNNSPATGWVTVTFDLDLITMRVQASFSGLTGVTTAAHIHGPTAAAFTGTAGVMTTTPSFIGFPLGVTGGSMDQTYDMTLASSYRAGFISSVGGIANAFNTILQSHRDGKAYFNVHTQAFPGGEIRGFLPTPGAAGVMLLGGLVAGRRRRA